MNPEARWYTRLVAAGAVESCLTVGARIDDDPTIIVEGMKLEGRLVETARRLAAILAGLGVAGPLALNASLHDLEQVQVSTPRRMSRPLAVPGLDLGTVVAPVPRAVTPQLLRPILNAIWLASGFEDGSPSFQREIWEGEEARSLYEPVTIGVRAW